MMADPAAPTPETSDPDVGELFVYDAQCVDQGCQGHNGGAVLVVVEHRNVQLFAETVLDLEAARRGDVFKVHAAVDGRECL